MKDTCDKCGYNAHQVRASLRRTLAECEECGNTYCDECLKEMAIAKGVISESDANLVLDQSGANGLLWKCEESDLDLCPECFEDETAEAVAR